MFNSKNSGEGKRADGAWHRVKPWVAAGVFTFWLALLIYAWVFKGEVDVARVTVLALSGYFFIDLLGELFDGG